MIPENPWAAEFFDDIPIEISAISSPGYRFSLWAGLSGVGEDITVTLDVDLNLTAVFVEDNDPGMVVYINELLASNDTTNVDEAGEFDDWIELYNAGTELQDIGGLFLTDNADNLTKWMIPDGTEIQPQSFLLFWCDEDQEQGDLHTNFKLSGDGEFLSLVNFDGITLLDSITFGPQSADISYGRVSDGGSEWNFLSPTPEGENVPFITEISISYNEGWNLVGLPLEVEDASYHILFPESIDGTLYSFDGGYISESYLEQGEGYWLRFGSGDSTTIVGTPSNALAISLNAGWNLVSGLSEEVSIYSVSDPDLSLIHI